MFASDRDLLVLEPMLLSTAVFASQTVFRGTVIVEESNLIVTGGSLGRASVQPGMLVLVGGPGGVSLEIVSLISEDRASVSLPRASVLEPVRPPPTLVNVPGLIVTYQQQIAVVHGQLLRMLGLSEGTTSAGGPLAEDRVKNSDELALLEALGTLHLVFSAASALTGPGSPAGARAEMYRDRFSKERWRAEARIDTDGDGVADAVRRFNVGMLVRG